MKKATLYLICLLILFSLVFSTAFAENDNTYYIKEYDMSITIPKDFTVFTRDIKADDPNLAKFGVTRDSLVSNMKARGNYLDALTEDRLTEIYINVNDRIGIDDFSTMSDAMLKEIALALYSELKTSGVTVTKDELYHHAQTTFIKLYGSYSAGGTTTYIREYCTVYNGNLIMITMASYAGQISASHESALQSAIESIQFDTSKNTANTPEPKQTQAAQPSEIIYIDQKTGLKFTVPAGWKEEPLSKKRETIDVKFVSEGAAFAEIMYGSIDMWSSIPEADKAGMNRSDVNNTLFSLEDISVMMGSYSGGTTSVSYNDITTVTYNGSEYFCLKANTSSSGITIPMTQLMHIDNGYIYLFQYYGDRTGENYNGFESLLKSTVYSTPQASVTATPKPTAKPTTKPTATAKPTTATNSTSNSSSNSPSYTSYNRTNNYTGLKWATIIGIALWALIPGFIAKKKGRSFWGYYFLSFVITPLVTMIITLCLKDRNKVNTASDFDIQTEQKQRVTEPIAETNKDTIEHNTDEPIDNSNAIGVAEPAPIDEKVETTTEVESKNKESKKDEDTTVQSAEEIRAEDADPTSDDNKTLRFCRYCGFELLENSEFCSHCGKKVR